MRKRLILWAILLVALLSGLVTIPNMVQSSIPSIYYVTPEVKTYENVVNCAGTVVPEREYQVYASSAFVPGTISVALGDVVSEEQSLLNVDREATGRLSQSYVNGLITNATEEIRSELVGFDLSELLSRYGLGDLLSGMDAGQLLSEVAGTDMAVPVPEASITLTEPESTEVRAPAYGIVTEINVTTGSPVSMGQALFTIQDIKSYKVIAAVGESDISKIKVGDRALIRGVGFSGITFSGYVGRIHPTARKTLNGTSADTVVDVEVIVENPNNNLKSGFSAKVEISGDQSYQMITVPYEAIRQDENNEEYVYLYEDGKLQKRPVITGREFVSEVEVLEGISTESVIIYNPDDVPGEGSIVNIKGRAKVV